MAMYSPDRKKLAAGMVLVILAAGLYMFLREPEPPVDPDIDHEVELYFATPDAMYLDTESRTVDGENFYYNVLQELIAGPESEELSATMPEGTQIVDLEHDREAKRLKVNFNENWRLNHGGGSAAERLTIYSVVNTMTVLPEVEEVLFRVEGQEVESLAGHMDLTAAYGFTSDIVRDEEMDEEIDEEEFDVEIEDKDED